MRIIAVFLVMIFSLSLCGAKFKELEKFEKAQKLKEEKQYLQAIQMYREYMKENPDSLLNVVCELYTGDCYRDLGRYKEAETSYRDVINTYKNKESKYWRQTAKERLDELEKLRKRIDTSK